MSKRLAAPEIERYRRDGFLSPLRAFPSGQALAYRRQLEECERRFGPFEIGKTGSKSHLLFPWVDEIARHPAILDAVEDLIGPDVLIYTLTMWIKPPHTPAYVGWHQDASYFGLEPAEQITAWVALSVADEQSGCVQALPGSHLAGLMHHSVRERKGTRSLLPRGQSVSTELDTASAVSMPLAPGEFSLHDTLLVHGSEGKASADRRIGIGISYIPTRVRFIGSSRLTAMLVRGDDRFAHFDPEPRPAADCHPEAVEFHRRTLAAYFASKKELAAMYEPIDVAS